MMPVESWEDPYERVLVEDHSDPAQILKALHLNSMTLNQSHIVLQRFWEIIKSYATCTGVFIAPF
jgi:hypothetical protein